MDEYPHDYGDVIVLGPHVFVLRDETVLNWKGQNYVRQEEAEAERDRLRARMLELESQVGEREQHLRDAFKDTRAERDRLRVVVDMAREFDAADTAWHDKIARGENVRSTDDESRRRAGAILALLDAVRQLDGSADMGDSTCPDCGNPLRFCDCPDREASDEEADRG